MKKGYLSQHFEGVAVKHLSPVEADTLTSNQHEFNGVEALRNILGEPDGKTVYPATFMYLTDHDDEPVIEDGFLTWYDARQKARMERGVMRYEYRLYFPTNQVSQLADAGDILVMAKRPNATLLAIIAEAKTTIARQILWLFGFTDCWSHPGFSIRKELETEQDRIKFSSRFILESIGIAVQVSEGTWLDEILRKFSEAFPATREFSAFARSTLPDVNPQDDQDAALMAWMEREEILFRTFEKYLIEKQLSQGFDDVDGFISFSLSVQNRRKSRAGLALENHLEILFKECGIQYTRTPNTENKSKPDFIFPGIEEYQTPEYDPLLLTMLGVKSSCKDRWRQVLAEADRIEQKHLLTLEAAISENQTESMQAKNVQLVLPEELHDTYSDEQRPWLMNVAQFIEGVRRHQEQP